MIRTAAMVSLGRRCTLILGALLGLAATADAQYFGRNKVQYEKFDFRVLRTEHFDFHYYPEEERGVRDAARMGERWNARLQQAFNHTLSERKPIVLYANHPDFQQTNVVSNDLSEGTGGVTESLLNRVVMPLTGVYAENDHVLGHEMVHVYQYDIAASPTSGGFAGLNRLPLWLIEGMAEYLSLGRTDSHTAMWLRDAALRNELPTLKQLTTDPRFFPYRYGQALWAYIGGKWGDDAIPRLYRTALQTGFDGAIQRTLGISSDSLSKEWITAIRELYNPLIQGRSKPTEAGERLLYTKEKDGDMNLSPVLSPDGQYVAFYSRRGLFSVDLFVADARTGKIIKKLTGPSDDSHFDAISFIYSAGTWSPDGKKLAFLVFAEGDNEIEVLDVASGRIERQIHPRDIGAMLSLAWSPDGQQLAFSGIKGGESDLYLYEFTTGTTRRLTNDRYADLHPAWSPDGRTIAIATDRGDGTDWDRLTYAPMRLALVDAESGALRLLPVFEGAKHINPQFSPDGRDLYFISDRGGFSDIYRLAIDGSGVFQVTRLVTGVTGIAELSPAMSVARQTGRILFSVFEDGGTRVYGLDPERARGVPVTATAPDLALAGLLPPAEALERGTVSAYLRDPLTGLPPEKDWAVSPYRPRLRLLALGQPSLGVGVGGYGGTSVGGGASAYFGDLLGNRVLGVAVSGGGYSLLDLGGQVFFLNTERRFNWALSAGHIPYLTGGTLLQPRPDVRPDAYEINYVLQRVLIDEANITAQYPFSVTRRFELGGGFRRLSFFSEVQSLLVVGSSVVGEERRKAGRCSTTMRDIVCSPSSINLGQGSAAFVGDNSFFGFTSPIAGGRYRFEIAPTVGTLDFYTATADYRRYFFARPVTLAVRGFHYGRYGRDSQDDRLYPLYVGYGTLVRGYDPNSFDLRNCDFTAADPQPCFEFTRLRGSRIAVAGAELRIPLLGTEQFGIIRSPFLPVEIAPFVDAGIAWSRGQTPRLSFTRDFTTQARPVASAGISARINVLGYIILETYYARPFQRSDKNWTWAFQLSPGW